MTHQDGGNNKQKEQNDKHDSHCDDIGCQCQDQLESVFALWSVPAALCGIPEAQTLGDHGRQNIGKPEGTVPAEDQSDQRGADAESRIFVQMLGNESRQRKEAGQR